MHRSLVQRSSLFADCTERVVHESAIAVLPSALFAIQDLRSAPRAYNNVRRCLFIAEKLQPNAVYELEIGSVPSDSDCFSSRGALRRLRFALRADSRGRCTHLCTIRLSRKRLQALFGTQVCLRPLNERVVDRSGSNAGTTHQMAILGRTAPFAAPLHESNLCSMMQLL